MKPKVAAVIAATMLSFVFFGIGAILVLKINPPDVDYYTEVETPAPLPSSGLAILTDADDLEQIPCE